MSRVLTGIQSSGTPHLGNILGAILPALELAKNPDNQCLFFIANLHSLTSKKDAELVKENTYATAAAWLAFGFDTDKNILYRQSDVAKVTELTWYLSCVAPYPMLANAHSFKDKSENLSDVNTGLFTYPVLMAADILLYDAEVVPVGKDQKQHLEMTRDIAGSFNHHYGETFVIPESKIDESVMTIPGLDGRKMSKSYGNFINIFLEDKPLRKQIMKIVTDTTPMEEPKNPDTCNVFALYKLIATEEKIAEMRKNYEGGNYGYGHAKQALFEAICEKFAEPRAKFKMLMDDKEMIDAILAKGSKKADAIGSKVLSRVRTKLGFE
ncbi:MAG: tryptophan--tRNA ligase [Flavobacteriales bacterium]